MSVGINSASDQGEKSRGKDELHEEHMFRERKKKKIKKKRGYQRRSSRLLASTALVWICSMAEEAEGNCRHVKPLLEEDVTFHMSQPKHKLLQS